MAATTLEQRRKDMLTELAALLGLMVLAAIGHGVLLVALWLTPILADWLIPPPPEPEIFEVSLEALAHSDSAMAQMDVTTAPPEAPVDVEAPDPVEAPGIAEQGTTEAVDTPNPSDLEFKQEDAPEEQQGDPDRRKALLEQMEQADREKRRRDMLAALGTADSTAGDPDSTSSESIRLGGNGRSDPELARYVDRVRKIFFAQFHPLPQLKSVQPPLETRVRVQFDLDTGRIQSWSIEGRSGNPSWDGAAERAIEAVSSIPVPPERLRDLFEPGMAVTFSPDAA